MSQKKVIVRRFDDAPIWGYLPQSGFVNEGNIDLIDPAGRVICLQMKDIKLIAYVRDFNLDDSVEPERIGRRTFAGRPRGEGIWLRIEFRDGDPLEGLVPVDVGLLDSLVDDGGLLLTPPDGRSNASRLFIPRSAVTRLEALGYVTAPSKRKAITKGAPDHRGGDQQPLFER